MNTTYSAIEDILVEKISEDSVLNIEAFLGFPITDYILEKLETIIREKLDCMDEDELRYWGIKYKI